DLGLLQVTNIPISNFGHGKGYAFISNFSMYPLDWTEKEALAFTLLPPVLEQIKPLLPDGFDTAYEKVMGAHRKEKTARADLLQHVADVIQMGSPAYREDGSTFLNDIIQAALSERTIRTVYFTQSRVEESRRDIDPYF